MQRRKKRKIFAIVLGSFASALFLIWLLVWIVLGPWRMFFWDMPVILGFFWPRTYLVLVQNNAELRPTGGFITAVAEINVLFGVPKIKVIDSYEVPNPSPKISAPEPFEYFIGNRDPFFAGWTFRDSNFSPDFQKSAENAIELYQKAFPDTSIDGVMAVDFTVIEDLFDLYGSILLADTEVTSDNFFLVSQRLSKNIDTHDTSDLKTRKDSLKTLGSMLVKKIISSPLKYDDLLSLLFRSAKTKHALFMSLNQQLNQKFINNNLTQKLAQPSESSDFLHLNIANIGGRKSDRYMRVFVNYLADFSQNPQANATLNINLEHLGDYNIQSDIYQAYLRTYVPAGSMLQSRSGRILRPTETTSDLGFTVFSDYIRIKPGEKLTLEYQYLLPKNITIEDYRLKIAKQAGTDHQFWSVAVKGQNDHGLEDLSPPEEAKILIRESLAFYQWELLTDALFHLRQKKDETPPLILWQEFKNLTTVNIRFQENLDIKTALDPSMYFITDADEKNPTHDLVTVASVRLDDRDVWLTVEGVTRQPEERYELTLSGIQDSSGNLLSELPLKRTLVQRIP